MREYVMTTRSSVRAQPSQTATASPSPPRLIGAPYFPGMAPSRRSLEADEHARMGECGENELARRPARPDPHAGFRGSKLDRRFSPLPPPAASLGRRARPAPGGSRVELDCPARAP